MHHLARLWPIREKRLQFQRLSCCESGQAKSLISHAFFRELAKVETLLSASGVLGLDHATRAATRAPSRALPLRRALCTNWKKPRYEGSLSCEMPRCGRSHERSGDQKPSMVLTWTSQKPSPSSSRAYSPRRWWTVLCR